MAKKKDKRTNSQKHKENVSKDLRKKRIAKQKENAKRYAYNGGGSRVIERSKTDVGRAPAMRGEPIKSKGFVNTYPYMTGSGQGFFDQRQMLNEALSGTKRALTMERLMIATAQQNKMNDEQMAQFVSEQRDLLEQQSHNEYARKTLGMTKKLAKDNAELEQEAQIQGFDPILIHTKDYVNLMHNKYGEQAEIIADNLKKVKEIKKLKKSRQEKQAIIDAEAAQTGWKPNPLHMHFNSEDVNKLYAKTLVDTDNTNTLEAEVKKINREIHALQKRQNAIIASHNEMHAKTKYFDQFLATNNTLGLDQSKVFEDPKYAEELAKLNKGEWKDVDMRQMNESLAVKTKRANELYEQMEKQQNEIMDTVEPLVSKMYQHQKKVHGVSGYLWDIMKRHNLLSKEDLQKIDRHDITQTARLFSDILPRITVSNETLLHDIVELSADVDQAIQMNKSLLDYDKILGLSIHNLTKFGDMLNASIVQEEGMELREFVGTRQMRKARELDIKTNLLRKHEGLRGLVQGEIFHKPFKILETDGTQRDITLEEFEKIRDKPYEVEKCGHIFRTIQTNIRKISNEHNIRGWMCESKDADEWEKQYDEEVEEPE